MNAPTTAAEKTLFDTLLQGVQIPPRPDTLVRVEAEARKDEPDLREIERTVELDAGVSAGILRIVNSPFYGLRMPATSVRQAISMLGLASVTKLVTAISLRNMTNGSQNAAEIAKFWDQSAESALVAAHLSKHVHGVTRDQAFTFGQFRDCGIPLMLSRFASYPQTLAQVQTGASRFLEVEMGAHGVSHAYIGSLVAKTWGIPGEIALAIRHHHDYDRLQTHELAPATLNLIAIGLLAERAIGYHTGFERTAEWQAGGELAMDHFGLDEHDFEGLADEVLDILAEAHG